MATKWSRMKQAIWKAARKAGMITISKREKGTKVWFNGECKEQRRKVWQSLKRYISMGSAIEKENLKAERIKKKGGKLYVAFVDFKAAFDKVNRKLMLRKIWEKGINGKKHRMIRGIYRETNNEVISEEGISEGF